MIRTLASCPCEWWRGRWGESGPAAHENLAREGERRYAAAPALPFDYETGSAAAAAPKALVSVATTEPRRCMMGLSSPFFPLSGTLSIGGSRVPLLSLGDLCTVNRASFAWCRGGGGGVGVDLEDRGGGPTTHMPQREPPTHHLAGGEGCGVTPPAWTTPPLRLSGVVPQPVNKQWQARAGMNGGKKEGGCRTGGAGRTATAAETARCRRRRRSLGGNFGSRCRCNGRVGSGSRQHRDHASAVTVAAAGHPHAPLAPTNHMPGEGARPHGPQGKRRPPSSARWRSVRRGSAHEWGRGRERLRQGVAALDRRRRPTGATAIHAAAAAVPRRRRRHSRRHCRRLRRSRRSHGRRHHRRRQGHRHHRPLRCAAETPPREDTPARRGGCGLAIGGLPAGGVHVARGGRGLLTNRQGEGGEGCTLASTGLVEGP